MDKKLNNGAMEVSSVPWGMQPSLKEMTEEMGIDFDDFIASLEDREDDVQMAQKFAVDVRVIAGLREHFEKYGIDSVQGGP